MFRDRWQERGCLLGSSAVSGGFHRVTGVGAERGAVEAGVLVADGRWYFITYPFRSYDRREAHVELVDIGPAPARGTIARIEGVQSETSSNQMALVCPEGVVPADVVLTLLHAAGVQPATGDPVPVAFPGVDHVDQHCQERPGYQEAAQLLLQGGRPADGVVAGLVGIARVLLELSAGALGSPSSRAVLADVVKNLVLEVENPDALIPD